MKKFLLQLMIIISILLYSNTFYSYSQTTIQAGAFVNGANVDVKIKPNADINTSAYLNDASFTLRCPDNAKTAFIGMGNITFVTNPYGFTVTSVGTYVGVYGPTKYIAFKASPTNGATINWVNNTEYPLVTFKITGGAGRVNMALSDDNPPNVQWHIELGSVDYTPVPFHPLDPYDYHYYQQTVTGVPLGLVADFTVPGLICQNTTTLFPSQCLGTTWATTTYQYDFDGSGGVFTFNTPNTNYGAIWGVVYTTTIPTQVTLVVINGPLTDTVTKTISISPQPVITAWNGNSNQACVGDNIFLYASSLPGATYSWVGPDSFSANIQNPYSILVNNSMVATLLTYTVTAYVGGCPSAGMPTSIYVNRPAPIVDAGNNMAICQGSPANLSGNISGSGTGIWTLVSGPAFTDIFNLIAIGDQTNLNAPILNTALPGTYILKLTSTLTGYCVASKQVTITINQTPATPSGFSNSPVCSGSSINLGITGPVTGLTYQWSGPNGFNATGSTTSFTASGTASGAYTVVASDGLCNSAVSAAINVTVNPLPAVDAGSTVNILCQGTSANMNGSFSGVSGTVGTWSLISGPAGMTIFNLISPANINNPTAPIITTAQLGTYNLLFTAVTPAGCMNSDITTVTIDNPSPSVPSGTSNSPVCAGNQITLSVIAPVAGQTYQWFGPNSYNATGSTVSFTATSLSTGAYTVTASNGTCNSAVSTAVNVTVNPLPTVDAGNNVTIQCLGTTVSNLSGSVSGGTGTWSLVSGPAGMTITNLIAPANINNPTAPLITTAPLGVYNLMLTAVSLSGCSAYDYATVTLNDNIPATPSGTSNSPVCAGNTINLSVVGPVTGLTYQWSGPNGFNSTGTMVTNTASSTSGGAYTVIASDGTCNSAPSAAVNVTVNPVPTVSAGSNVTVQCQGTAASLSGSVSGGTGTWTLVSGPIGLTINNLVSPANINNPTAPLITTAPLGTYTLQFNAISASGCIASSNNITVTIVSATPSMPSGTSNSPVCSGNQVTLSVVGPVTGQTYQWFGPNSYNATGSTVNFTATNMSTGAYTVTASNGTCNSAVSTAVNVTVNPLPTVDAGNNVTIQCLGTTVSNLSGSVSGGTGTWSLVSGPAGMTITNLIAPANINNPTALLITTASLGTYNLMLTAVSLNGCSAYDYATVTLNDNIPATPSGTSNSPVCAGNTINLSVVGPVTGLTYQWSGPNGFNSTGTMVTNTASSTSGGAYTVIASDGTCNSAPSAAVNVTVNPVPTVSAGSNVTVQCQGTAASLSGSVSGGTGTWTLVSGPIGLTINNLVSPANINNPTAPLITTAPLGTYTLQFNAISASGCIASSNNITVTIVSATPSMPSGTSNSPVCSGNQVTLSVVGPVTGQTYQWFGPNSYNATGSTVSFTATSLSTGAYTVTASNGTCTSAASAAVNVSINITPTVSAGSNVTVQCQGTAASLSGSISGGTGTWTLVSGPTGTTISNLIAPASINNPTAPLITTASIGTYTLQFNAISAAGCTASSNIITVTIVSLSPSIPSGTSNSPVCSGSQISLSVVGPITGTTYQWYGPNGFNATGSSVSLTATSLATGAYTVTASNGTCTSAASTAVNITVNPLPVVVAGSTVNVLCQGTPANLNGSVTGGTATWSLSSGPAGMTINNLISPANINNTTAPLITTSQIGTYNLKLTAISAFGCTASDVTTVNINHPTPSTPSGTSNSPVCSGSMISLSVVGPITGTTYQWYGPNGYNSTGSAVNLTATSIAAGSYTVTASNGTCTSAASTAVNITVNPLPIVSAGSNVTIQCQGTAANLSGSVSGGTGTWSLVSGPAGLTISNLISPANINNPTAPLITTASLGTYTLQFNAISAAGCTASSSNITVTIVSPAPSTPSGTSNSPVCSGSQISLSVVGPVTGTTYQWYGPNGFNATGSSVSLTATSVATGAYTVTASNGTCTSAASAAVNVTVNPLPVVNAGSNVTIQCQGTAASLNGSVSGGTGTWSLVSGPAGLTISNIIAPVNITNPTAPLITTAPIGIYSLQFTALSAAGCSALSNIITVSILNSSPAVPSGFSNSPVCIGNTISLGVVGPVSGITYQWSGPIGFNATGSTVNFTSTGTSSGAYTVTASNGTCTSAASAAVNVIVNPLPTANAGSNVTIQCQGMPASLNGSVSGGTGVWSLVSGPATMTLFNIINPVDINNPTASLITTAQIGTYNLKLTTTSVAGCIASGNVTVTIVNSAPAIPMGFSNSPQCAGSTISLGIYSPFPGLIYQWSGPNGFYVTGTTVTRVASLNATGNYFVTASNGTCTSGASTAIAVVVNTLPTVDAGATVNVQCQGTAASLSGTVTGGTATWSLISGPAGLNLFNIVNPVDINNPVASLITTSQIGTYNLQLTAVTVNGCTANDQTTLTINHPQPSVPSGFSNSPVCDGSTISLSVTGPITGQTYQWYGPSGFNATGTTVTRVASVIANGAYSVFTSNGTCTSNASAPVNIVVNPLPTVEAGSTVNIQCQGTPASLNGSVGGGTGYWSLMSGPTNATIFSIINPIDISNPFASLITTSQLGTYNLKFTAVSINGCTAFDVTTVSINHPLPNIPVPLSNSPVCEKGTISLEVSLPLSGIIYQWSGPGGFNATGSTVTFPATIAASGNYTVTASNGTCTSGSSAPVTITVNPTPQAPTAWNNSPICQHDTLFLHASNVLGASYVWSGPAITSIPLSTAQNPVIPNAPLSAAGIYTVKTYFGSCGSDPVTTVVFINPAPDPAQYITSSPVCVGDKLVITAVPLDPKADYHWVVPNKSITTTVANVQTINYSAMADSGNYSVYLTYVNGCFSPSVSGVAVVNRIPSAPVLGGQITKCELDTVFLYSNSIANAAYFWSGPNSFTSNLQNPDPIIASIASEGVYNLYVKVNGCNSPLSKLLLTINPLPAIPALITNGPLCLHDALKITVTNPLSGGTYVWTHPDPNHSGGNVFTSTVPELVINSVDFKDSGVYTAKVIGSRCTSLSGSVKLDINPLPDPTITASGPTSFCKNDSVTLSAQSGIGYTYLWSTGQTTQSIIVKIQGWYYLTVTSSAGCKNSDSIYITVWPLPVANAGRDTTISKGFSVRLHGSGGRTYLWSPSTGLDDPTRRDPIASPLVTTKYMLVVSNEYGCLDTAYVTVFVNDDYLIQPSNLITANGDGINDTWYVGNILNYPDNRVMIFNRYGNKIYDVRGYANAWTGAGFPNGTYYYVIIFDNSPKIYKGAITIISK